ncbi:MAG: nitroreductase [Hyphomonadaceae bacterium]|nr:nitroreductase [Hyphomonadaceae bacterium]
MSLPIPVLPAENELCNAICESADMLALLARRRSTKVVHFTAPGPSSEELDALIRLAARVPDHGKLGPWRFVAIEGDARVRAGEALASVLAKDNADQASLDKARETFLRAPVCVMVVSTAAAHPKIPEWEQQLSVGAVCFSLLLTAHAAGYGGCWLTGWPCYDARARGGLGLGAQERIAGFIHLGAPTERPTERVRADIGARISRF